MPSRRSRIRSESEAHKAKRLAAPVVPRARIKPVNPQRKAKEWRRAFGSVERVNFVAGRPCVACEYGRNCENHHIQNGGKSRKADARFIVPLCWVCHREYHDIGRPAFEAYYEIDLDVCAAETEAAWQAHCAADAA